MVLFSLTPELSARLEQLVPLLPRELVDLVRFHLRGESSSVSPTSPVGDETIDHQVLVRVAAWAQAHADEVERKLNEPRDQYRLAALIKLTQVYAPPLVPREKSPELVSILSAIQLSQDRISYSSLTSLSTPQYRSLLPLTDPHEQPPSTSTTTTRLKTVAEEWSEIKKELSAIVNVACSALAVFTAVWYVGFGYSPAIRLGLSLLGAATISAIESWLYYRVFDRVERGKREQLVVASSLSFPGSGSMNATTTRTTTPRGGERPVGKVLKFE